MGRIIGFLFGLLAYAIFLGTFLYAVGFVSGVAVPKTIDSGPVAPVAQALIINILLMSLFAVQHKRDGAQAVQALVDAIHPGHDRAQHIRAVGPAWC
jgi:protein-S-isoprenylcysteine O-methyltransferase Ste14